ncbi:MAG: hypothetical protein H5U17_15710 [Defluviimonas sp.]|nr:hypothetical protein [Defluviimonas sp.]
MSRGDAFSGLRGGRSSLLRAGFSPPSRPRNWALRYAVILTLAALMVALVLALRGEMLSPEGPGRALYLIHDELWLPLYGRVWTAIFPDAFIWLAILGGLSTLVLMEFLGIASPLRRTQVGVLSVLLRSAPGPVLAMHRLLRAVGLRAGMAEQVLRDMRDDALYRFTGPGAAQPDVADFRRLCDMQRLQVAFGLKTPRDLVAVVDILGLASVKPGARDDAAEPLRRAAAALMPQEVPFWVDLMAPSTFPMDLSSVLQASIELETADAPPEALACQTVRIASFLATGGDETALVWFDIWARLRAGADSARAARLAEAEALCAFEYWAARAEAAVLRHAPPLLSEAFPGLHLSRPRGEVEAARSVLSGSGS